MSVMCASVETESKGPAVSAYPTPCETERMYKNQKKSKKLGPKPPCLIAHYRPMCAIFLHKNTLLNALFLNL